MTYRYITTPNSVLVWRNSEKPEVLARIKRCGSTWETTMLDGTLMTSTELGDILRRVRSK